VNPSLLWLWLWLWLALASGPALGREASTEALPAAGTVQVLFTPGDAVDDAIISAIGAARREVLVQAYIFTHRRIASALIRAQRRGVRVEIIADAQQAATASNSVLRNLARAGVAVFLDAGHDSAHNKVLILDPESAGATVITGSFNFTYSAQTRNAENVVIFRGHPSLAAEYAANWRQHRAHAAPYGAQ
jgi:phosphatidylserine/phosphatidylglycerophosphate/cardiolipin synthase-like enzyme